MVEPLSACVTVRRVGVVEVAVLVGVGAPEPAGNATTGAWVVGKKNKSPSRITIITPKIAAMITPVFIDASYHIFKKPVDKIPKIFIMKLHSYCGIV